MNIDPALPQFVARDCAWDYVSGDLTPEQNLAVEHVIATDSDFAATVERLRWRHDSLRVGAPGPTPDMVERVMKALPQSAKTASPANPLVLRPKRWLPGLRAAALVAVGCTIGIAGINGWERLHPPMPADAIAFTEDGAPLLPPSDRRSRLTLPTALAGFTDHRSLIEKPWLGVTIRPLTFDLPDQPLQSGLLVVQVAAGSPAAMAGIRPGDVMLTLNDRRLFSGLCIAHALRSHTPGDVLNVAYYSPPAHGVLTKEVTLATRFD